MTVGAGAVGADMVGADVVGADVVGAEAAGEVTRVMAGGDTVSFDAVLVPNWP